MKQILVFALKEDWLPVLKDVEVEGALQYAIAGHFPDGTVRALQRGADLPGLGRATAESYINSQSFLLGDRHATVRSRPIKPLEGGARFCVDQLDNPDSVWLTPGGLWSQGIVVSGCVATVSETTFSQALMARFGGAIRSHFTKVKAFHVGQAARALLDSGWRLTTAAQSPTEYDLRTGS